MFEFKNKRYGFLKSGHPEAWWLLILISTAALVVFFGASEVDRRFGKRVTVDATAMAEEAAKLLTSTLDTLADTAYAATDSADELLQEVSDSAELARALGKLPLPEPAKRITAVEPSGRIITSRSGRHRNAEPTSNNDTSLIIKENYDGIYTNQSVRGIISGPETIHFIKRFQFPDGTLRRIYIVSYSLDGVLRLFDAVPLTPKSIVNITGQNGLLHIAAQHHSRGTFRLLSGDVVSALPARLNTDEHKWPKAPPPFAENDVRLVFASAASDEHGFSTTVGLNLNAYSQSYKDLRDEMFLIQLLVIATLLVLGIAAYFLRERQIKKRALEKLRKNESEILRSLAKLDNLAIATVSKGGQYATVTGSTPNELTRYIEENWGSILSKTGDEADEPSIHRFQDQSTSAWGEIAIVTNVADATEHRAEKILLALDLTQMRQKANKLYQLSKLASIGGLSTAIAHEIHQPLGTIWFALHNARTLLEKGDIPAVEPKFKLIESQIEKIKKYVDHLRQFGRPVTRIDPYHEVDVVQVVEAATELLKVENEIYHTSIAVRVSPESSRYLFLGDPNSLEQVIINLLQNARYAIKERMASGSIRQGKIDIFIAADAANVIIDVSDNGGGIAPDVLPHIFELFFTTKSIEEGTGLGLSISQDIVRGLGGMISAENIDGGVRFTIKLPKSDLAPIPNG